MLEQRSLITSIKDELYDQLLSSVEQHFDQGDQTPQSLGEWAESTPITLDGKPFSFLRHEYLWVPYQDDHPHVVEMKATQMGLTTKAMLKALYGLRYKGYIGVLEVFPSRTDVLDFSKSRISPLIEENPNSIGKWVRETDSAGLKKVWNGFLYLRGMQSRSQLTSPSLKNWTRPLRMPSIWQWSAWLIANLRRY
jgi:hypothetical protein